VELVRQNDVSLIREREVRRQNDVSLIREREVRQARKSIVCDASLIRERDGESTGKKALIMLFSNTHEVPLDLQVQQSIVHTL
jgi:hypothetical protein